MVRLDGAAPVLSASAYAGLRPSLVPVEVTLGGGGPGIGVASISYTTTGALETPATTVEGTAAVVTVGEAGTTTVTATAIDRLGRERTGVDRGRGGPSPLDASPPEVTCGNVPAAWQRDDVVLTCSATDPESGLAADSPAQFELRTSVPTGTELADAVTDSRTICNQDGACTQAGPFGGAKVDKRPPVVTVAYPRPGEQVIRNAAATTDTVCQDGGSGVASCPLVPLSTSTLGAKTVTVTGTDAVGNATTVTVGYTVIHQWNGFQLPTFDPPFVNPARTGSTYPVRFSISDASAAHRPGPSPRDPDRVPALQPRRLPRFAGGARRGHAADRPLVGSARVPVRLGGRPSRLGT